MAKWLNKAASCPSALLLDQINMRHLIAILNQRELPASVPKVKFIVLVNVLSE